MIQTISRNMNGADEFQKGFREFAFGYRSRTQAASRGSARVDLGHRRSPSVGAVHPPDRVRDRPEPKPGPPTPRLGRGPRDPPVAQPAAGARSRRPPTSGGGPHPGPCQPSGPPRGGVGCPPSVPRVAGTAGRRGDGRGQSSARDRFGDGIRLLRLPPCTSGAGPHYRRPRRAGRFPAARRRGGSQSRGRRGPARPPPETAGGTRPAAEAVEHAGRTADAAGLAGSPAIRAGLNEPGPDPLVETFRPSSPDCAFCPRGLNRSAVGKTQVSFTSRRPQQLAPSTLTSLLACTNALRRAILRHGYAWRQPRSDSSLRGRPALFPERAPCPSIQSTLKQKLCPSRLRPPSLHPQGRRGLS